MSKTITKYLLALCLICNVANVFAQHRYYCEVKGIEKDLSSGLKIIFDFGTKASYNIWGDLSSKLKFVMKMVKKSNSTAWSMPQITWLIRGGTSNKPILLLMAESL